MKRSTLVAALAAAKLDKSLDAGLVKEFAVLQPVKAAPYFTHVQVSSPDVLVALSDPDPDFVLVKAMWHYARAAGFARKRAFAEAQREIDALGAIERSADFKAVTDWQVPAREIVHTARAVASGRLADARGDLRGLVELYRQRGDTAALAATRKRFESTWMGPQDGPAMSLL